jgi:uncharacterized protein (TIGR02284 family)
MKNDDTIDTLKKLIETSKDGEAGFETCAKQSDDPQLKAFFEERARSCHQAHIELQNAVASMGGDPEESGSVSGAIHRGWVNIKTALTSNDDLAVLEECERGEDVALAAYRDALKEPIPADVRTVIERQYEGVRMNHDRVRAMRDARRGA